MISCALCVVCGSMAPWFNINTIFPRHDKGIRSRVDNQLEPLDARHVRKRARARTLRYTLPLLCAESTLSIWHLHSTHFGFVCSAVVVVVVVFMVASQFWLFSHSARFGVVHISNDWLNVGAHTAYRTAIKWTGKSNRSDARTCGATTYMAGNAPHNVANGILSQNWKCTRTGRTAYAMCLHTKKNIIDLSHSPQIRLHCMPLCSIHAMQAFYTYYY